MPKTLPIRSKTWSTRELHEYLTDHVNTPFAWGVYDCCLMAANAIQAMTGVDIASDFRHQYSDQASAFALIKKITGGSTVADAAVYCATKHGLPEWKHPLMAQRGDLVVFENEGNLIAGIVHLSGRHVVSISESGLVKAPITAVQRAWHVPAHEDIGIPAERFKHE